MTIGKQAAFALFVTAAALAAPQARAGDNNVLRVIQESPSGSITGNTLFADQSNASNSLVIGPSAGLEAAARGLTGSSNLLSVDALTSQAGDPDSEATQRGSGNTASIVMSGDGGEVQLLQDNSLSGFAGNSANVTTAGNALGAVLQTGDSNKATLDIDAGGKGLIAQNGNSNEGSLSVDAGGTGKLVQNGNGNFYPVTVNAGTNVTVTQNGSGLQPVGIAGMQVYSTNPGAISITQTGFQR